MKEFKTEYEAEIWLKENFQELIQYVQDNCSNGDKKNPAYILRLYGGNVHRNYNGVLNVAKGNFESASEYFKGEDNLQTFEEIKILNQYICQFPLPQDLILYRYEKMSLKGVLELLFSPKTTSQVNYGFLSTTLLPFSEGMITLKKEKGFNILYKLNAPKGLPAVPLQFSSEQTTLKEYEMLLPIEIEKKLVGKRYDLNRRILTIEFDLLFNGSSI